MKIAFFANYGGASYMKLNSFCNDHQLQSILYRQDFNDFKPIILFGYSNFQ